MELHGYAGFVERPRRIEDLIAPHPIEKERPFRIVTSAELTAIDYESFIKDMVADRQFIEDYGKCCKRAQFGTACSSAAKGRATAS